MGAREVIEAREAWLAARRAVQRALPWTTEWLRLRMDEHDRRLTYFRLDSGAPGRGLGSDDIDDTERFTQEFLAAADGSTDSFEIDPEAELGGADLLLEIADAQTVH
jgi:hypothetical protein